MTAVSDPERLTELDLTVDVVAAALAAADRESARCSDLDPPILEGLLRWGRATRALREQLVPLGWTYDNPNNLARTIHPSGDFAVVLATGDAGTGQSAAGAGPRHSRGYATEQAIAANGQLTFEFGSLLHLAGPGRPVGLGHLRTWLLLYHAEPDCFHAELSLPQGIDRGRITRWTERILLPPLPRGLPAGPGGGPPARDALTLGRTAGSGQPPARATSAGTT